GARLPSSRQLAHEWGYTRGAVDEAYAQLQAEGLLERRTGDGSYVAWQAHPAPTPAPASPVLRPVSAAAQKVRSRLAAYLGPQQKMELPVASVLTRPLFPRAAMTAAFPLDTWRRLVARAYGEEHRAQLGYGDAAGLRPLREAIVRHLALARGTPCHADQVLILNSPTQAIELIARVLLEPGDTVWVEDPGHSSLVTLFQALHARVVGVPLDADGLDVARGRALAPDAAAVYLHPLTQFPLGIRTTTARRGELMQWAETSGAWVIEGNFNDEIAHDGEAPAPLQAMNRSDRVLLMGTLEGVMFPSLRLAYLVVPARLADLFIAMRGLLGDHSNVGLQQAMAWFIDEGHMSRHLRTLRLLSRERGEALRAACARHLPPWAQLGPLGGATHACIHLPDDVHDLDVVRALRSDGLTAIALSAVCVGPAVRNGLSIGFGAFEPAVIDDAIRRIGAALRAAPMRVDQPVGRNT
ncbi:MAG: PLP-dependent aminotransferase family protein, partial [Bacteroidia bacterium]